MIETIHWLSIIGLLGLIVALGFLIPLLYRANKVFYKIDHMSDNVVDFIRQVMPAIVNIGTVTKAVHGILLALFDEKQNKSEKK